ncbi:MAG: FprA family A-type flavoprotein [Oscillospiraceae bacterium]
MKKLKDNIFYIGTINPNLRIFDIIMSTEYGTSYNSYLVKGEKIAVVETVHDRYSEIFFDNIKEITPLEKIDYIIMNHTEPDHSGSIAKLLEINPNITIVGSAAAIKNITNITNMEFSSKIVKTGDSLDLGGGMVLDFIISPNLHWPDSMFTYVACAKTIFTCDFLGAHYCEPMITDDIITYPKAYADAFAFYFTAIFGPFKKFVIDGLNKIKGLDFDMVCTSHGPVLKNGISTALGLYRKWATVAPIEKNVAIFYVSAYGYTKSLAKAFAAELEKLGIPTKTYNIIEHPISTLAEKISLASGVMFGSPTINRDAVKPVWDLLSSVDAVGSKGKPCAVFGSYGWSGEACTMLENRAEGLGFKLVNDCYKVVMKPDENDFNNVRALAITFAKSL